MDNKQAGLISASITTAINVASLALSENAACAFSAVSPVVQVAIEHGLLAIGAERLSEKEKHRIGSAVWWAAKVAEENFRLGKDIKQDLFKEEDITTLVEAVFRSASEDSQEKKDIAYGAFIGNFPFQDRFDSGALFSMAKLLKDMSFDELLLMAALKGQPGRNYESFYTKLDQEGDLRCGEMVGFLVKLRNLGLTIRVAPFNLGSNVGNLKLSALGEELCNQARLCDMDPEQCDTLRHYLDQFAKPVGF